MDNELIKRLDRIEKEVVEIKEILVKEQEIKYEDGIDKETKNSVVWIFRKMNEEKMNKE